MNLTIRQAVHTDIPVLRKVIEVSVRGLQTRDYSPSQIESALATVYGVDSQLITDGTYFVVEATSPEGNLPKAKLAKAELVIVGCGGWSRRKTLFGADHWTDAKIHCSAHSGTPPRFGHSLCTPIEHGGGSAA